MATVGLIRKQTIQQLYLESWPRGLNTMVSELASAEPELSTAVVNSMKAGMRMLDAFQLPKDVQIAMQDFLTAAAIVAVQSVRHEVYRFSQGTDFHQRLGQVWPDLIEERPQAGS